jgi:hypothetical protein
MTLFVPPKNESKSLAYWLCQNLLNSTPYGVSNIIQHPTSVNTDLDCTAHEEAPAPTKSHCRGRVKETQRKDSVVKVVVNWRKIAFTPTMPKGVLGTW